MSTETKLTEGAIEKLSEGDQGGLEVKPVLQVVDVRLINPTERYRLLLSDGIHLQTGMLGTQRSDLVRSQKLQKGSVVRLNQFVCSLLQNRRIIIVNLDVLRERCDPIGEPKPYHSNASPVVEPYFTVNPMNQSWTFPSSAPMHNLAVPGSAPMHNLAGDTRVQRAETPSNIRSNAHTSPFAANNYSERYNSTAAAPMYARTETDSGISGAPLNSYSRQPQAAVYQQPSPVIMNRWPIAKNEAPPKITPINALNPYQCRWTIKARVTAKGELRLYNNARGDGKVFSFDLLDSSGGEIRVACFNAVAEQFYNLIELGKVYMISKGTLIPAQKKFNQLAHVYEISLDNNTTIQPCFEEEDKTGKTGGLKSKSNMDFQA